MANTCKTCKRTDVDSINAMLVGDISLRNIVAQFDGLTTGGLDRHKDCITDLFAEVREDKRKGLLKDVDAVKAEIDTVKAEFPDNPNVRLGLVGKMLDVIEKEAKLTGAYTKEQENPNTIGKVLDAYNWWLEDNPKATATEKAKWIKRLAASGGVEAAEIGRRAGVQIQEVSTLQ